MYWRVHRNDPLTISLSTFPGLAFINPLVLFELVKQIAAEHNDPQSSSITMPEPDIHGLIDDTIYLSTEYIILLHETDADEYIPQNDFGAFLKNVRYQSKQYRMRNDAGISLHISLSKTSQLPGIYFPDNSNLSEAWVRTYPIDAAISTEDIMEADVLPKDFSPPVYDSFLLDSLKAFDARDYRTAILYAAMSMEVLAATKLDEYYQEYIDIALKSKTSDNKLRIVFIPQPGGNSTAKDPIYEFLTKRTDFSQLLHERPLYLMEKSMLIQDQRLYQNALRLYRTRNKIAHLGALPSSEPNTYFDLNQDGALQAIKCAVDIFRWFGEKARYPTPQPEVMYKVYSTRKK